MWHFKLHVLILQLGCVEGIRFNRITALAENGIFIAGAAGCHVANLTIANIQLDMTKRTTWPGGSQGYRPGVRGLVHSRATAPVWVEHVLFDHARVSTGAVGLFAMKSLGASSPAGLYLARAPFMGQYLYVQSTEVATHQGRHV
jgi:hypothetical protein